MDLFELYSKKIIRISVTALDLGLQLETNFEVKYTIFLEFCSNFRKENCIFFQGNFEIIFD